MRLPLLQLGLVSLLAGPALAQQPVLPGAPQPTQPIVPSTPAGQPVPAMRSTALPAAEVIGYSEVIGQVYSVETIGGTQFSGTLRATTDLTLTFETKELGLVTVQRANVRQLMSQTPEQARRGFDYVGNGTRMFIAPTARNLYQGEGYVQAINVFLLGVNYGLTDNISVGLLVPVIPFIGVPAIAIAPKLSVPVNDKLHLGVGVLYGFATGVLGGSGSAGVGYGLATYGTADTNVTLGLGYGFSGGDVGSSPVAVIGANVRLSRLFSLVNETYIANFDTNGAFGGLAGLRYASPRFSASLGALYYTSRDNSGVYPAYLDVAYRFGKTKLR
ncbi:hypothetical protein E4631_20560 [Hymenobacter sp. UV11]|uniref:hypothetical protein n=1 Tax=Hymenobacter sp. UV11 TaxID=1849735 RepID=UPI0010766391|nr:hypothetical protein [Hymenobacter sp. UV11]TFZ64020.1 hypothetical protein E4631_20560 [Hymenobacter sp. UV11]